MEQAVRARRWTRAEYERLIEIGVFPAGQAVEQATVSPLAVPGRMVRVGDFLP